MAKNWIKSWGYGARGRQIRDDWKNESHGLLMNAITFGPSRKPGLGTGDHVIYYAAGLQLLFAAGTVTSYAYWFESDGHTSWPWRVNVQLDDSCTKEFIHEGVRLDVLNLDGRNFGNLMKRRSHMTLSDTEWQAALDALRS